MYLYMVRLEFVDVSKQAVVSFSEWPEPTTKPRKSCKIINFAERLLRLEND
jgi:hypothetical protein